MMRKCLVPTQRGRTNVNKILVFFTITVLQVLDFLDVWVIYIPRVVNMAFGEMYKTGQEVPFHARYVWDHYTDETYTPFPTIEELTIVLNKGDTFPPVNSRDKGAWWKIVNCL